MSLLVYTAMSCSCNPDSTGIRRHLLPSRVEKGRRFVMFCDACATSSGVCLQTCIKLMPKNSVSCLYTA